MLVKPIAGNTSHIERENVSMRMGSRRFTRPTSVRALAIVGIHQTIRCSPAMEAKVTGKVRSIEDMVAPMDVREESAAEITRKGWAKRPRLPSDPPLGRHTT